MSSERGEAQKIRSSIGYTGRQATWIRTEARRLGIAESDVVRRVLDEKIDALESQKR